MQKKEIFLSGLKNENHEDYTFFSNENTVQDLTATASEDDSNTSKDGENKVMKAPTCGEACSAISMLLSYTENHNEFSFTDIVYWRNLQSITRKNEQLSQKQLKMTDFIVNPKWFFVNLALIINLRTYNSN